MSLLDEDKIQKELHTQAKPNQSWGLIGNKNIGSYSIAPKLWKEFLLTPEQAENYMVIGTEHTSDVLKFIQELPENIRGFNIARPWKSIVFEHCSWTDPVARVFRTINTVIIDRNNLIGINTDGIGLTQSILNHTSLKDKTIFIIGAGGAARTLPYYLYQENVRRIYITDIIIKKAIELQNKYKNEFNIHIEIARDIKFLETLNKTHIIINATPCGMQGHTQELPFTASLFKQINDKKMFVEMNYNPTYSALLDLAREYNHNVICGVEMLVDQAVMSYRMAFNTHITARKRAMTVRGVKI